MLVYFKVGNYKSIKKPLVINFEATSIGDHQNTNVIEKIGAKLLKTILLYGANASGKSKILDAFVTYRSLILKSTSYHSTSTLPIQPFKLNTETVGQPSIFEAEFIVNNKRYRYGFEADKEMIQTEWLLEVKKTTQSPVYLRIKQDFKINFKKFQNSEGLENKCNENVLFLSVADQWNVPLAKEIYKWFHEMVTIHGLNDHAYKNRTNELFEKPEYKELINSLMAHADLGIKSVNVVKFMDAQKEDLQKRRVLSTNNSDADNHSRVFARHHVYDSEGKIAGEESFDMSTYESEGTKKFYNFLGAILYSIKNGHFVVIDELDARFHTLLTKAIIGLFNSELVNSGSQLLAASHDIAVVDHELLRRDQIYIVEKDNFVATNVTNLAEYKTVRKETPFAKNYLEGKYGGIPFIENLENFLKNGKE
ncbi:AAA family ATPase [Chitinophaga tropicalis]|uniref:AAA family ATPase n=1 Tax=Chitinophaga tropicalis TaxID=2683588 RepID=A0A7K1U1Y3_9BACT|nr:ATP-binding protein [Chitinophaga tropicalis]MVT08382.1 AAA family ATPase [Chitinophaga tropicalis]